MESPGLLRLPSWFETAVYGLLTMRDSEGLLNAERGFPKAPHAEEIAQRASRSTRSPQASAGETAPPRADAAEYPFPGEPSAVAYVHPRDPVVLLLPFSPNPPS